MTSLSSTARHVRIWPRFAPGPGETDSASTRDVGEHGDALYPKSSIIRWRWAVGNIRGSFGLWTQSVFRNGMVRSTR